MTNIEIRKVVFDIVTTIRGGDDKVFEKQCDDFIELLESKKTPGTDIPANAEEERFIKEEKQFIETVEKEIKDNPSLIS